MFTKEVYKEYFLQILDIEKQMVEESRELAEVLDDPRLKKFMLHLVKDEIRHVSYAEELIRMTEEDSQDS